MSELQDKLDHGEITLQEFFDTWDREMAENERRHPGIHEIVHGRYLGDPIPHEDCVDAEQN
jgi:hypothetical protein